MRVTHADSPQAKGRVERLFRTLQDRLVMEMRFEKISTIEERISGRKIMTYRNKILKFKEITLRAQKQQKPTHNGDNKGLRYVPPVDHPWNNI